MTREHRLIVSLEEIKAIVVECTFADCGCRSVIAPEKIDAFPANCPRGHMWNWGIPQEPLIGSPFKLWLQLLKRIREPLNRDVGFKIFLEFDEPK